MKIENYSEANNAANGPVIATFDLVLDKMHLTLRSWKVLRSKKGGWFAVPPSYKKGEDEQGRPLFGSIIEIHEKRREEFQRGLHEALKPFVRDSSPNN